MITIFFHLDSHRVAEEIFLFCPILLALLEKKLNDTKKQNAPHGVSGVMFALSSWLPPGLHKLCDVLIS